LRDALGDSAESQRFIETLPRRGYRFIASVDGLDNDPDARDVRQSGGARPAPRVLRWLVALLSLAVLAAALFVWNVFHVCDRLRSNMRDRRIHYLAVLHLTYLSCLPALQSFF